MNGGKDKGNQTTERTMAYLWRGSFRRSGERRKDGLDRVFGLDSLSALLDWILVKNRVCEACGLGRVGIVPYDRRWQADWKVDTGLGSLHRTHLEAVTGRSAFGNRMTCVLLGRKSACTDCCVLLVICVRAYMCGIISPPTISAALQVLPLREFWNEI